MPTSMRRSDSDKVISMVLASKRRMHVHPRMLKLLTKAEVENGVITATTEDLFWSLNRELKIPASSKRRTAA